MSLSEKHRWCISKIVETFTSEGLAPEDAQGFMRQEIALSKFGAFFRGEGSGRLFVFYQPTFDGESKPEELKPKELEPEELKPEELKP